MNEEVDRLIERAGDGDDVAFTELHRRFDGFVRRIVGGDAAADVDDLCQRVWLAVRLALPRYDSQRATFIRWLEIIARRKAVSEWGRRQRERKLIEGMSNARPDGHIGGQSADQSARERELLAAVRVGADELRGREREVFCLRYYCDLSTEQIANACDVSEQRVRSALTEARKKLAECLQRGGFV